MKVREVMHRGITCAEPNTPIREVAVQMRTGDVGAIPVRENGRIIGMITDRDIACRAVADGRDIESVTAREVMTTGAVCCSEAGSAESAGR